MNIDERALIEKINSNMIIGISGKLAAGYYLRELKKRRKEFKIHSFEAYVKENFNISRPTADTYILLCEHFSVRNGEEPSDIMDEKYKSMQIKDLMGEIENIQKSSKARKKKEGSNKPKDKDKELLKLLTQYVSDNDLDTKNTTLDQVFFRLKSGFDVTKSGEDTFMPPQILEDKLESHDDDSSSEKSATASEELTKAG